MPDTKRIVRFKSTRLITKFTSDRNPDMYTEYFMYTLARSTERNELTELAPIGAILASTGTDSCASYLCCKLQDEMTVMLTHS